MSANPLLDIKNLSASVRTETEAEKEILRGVDLTIMPGETHVLMGVNGSGKSTLAYALMGHPSYRITEGKVAMDGKDITSAAPDEKAKMGMFLAFQYPVSVPGLSTIAFLRAVAKSVKGEEKPFRQFRKEADSLCEELDIPVEFLSRFLNEGFSGGEKKRMEILQMLLLEPRLAILDETDSGLDVDAMKRVFEAIRAHKKADSSLLVITHYNKIVEYIKPDRVHVLKDGRIVRSGGMELSERIEAEGFEAVVNG